MLVLNTTSPPVSPGAPAVSPSYQIPFSSASVAFIRSLSILQRTGDTRDLAGDHACRGRPRLLAGHLDPDHMRADAQLRDGQRRLANAAVVDKHGCAARAGIDVQRTGEGGRGRRS